GVTFDDGNSYLGTAEITRSTLDVKFLHSGNSYSIDNDNIAHRAGGTYDGRKVLKRKTYAPGKSLFSKDVAPGPDTLEDLIEIEPMNIGIETPADVIRDFVSELERYHHYFTESARVALDRFRNFVTSASSEEIK